MDHILYQTFRITLSILPKKHETVADNTPIRIHINKTKNRITFRIKTGYILELLMPEVIKLIGRIKSKDENGENVPHLQITAVVINHCNVVNNN